MGSRNFSFLLPLGALLIALVACSGDKDDCPEGESLNSRGVCVADGGGRSPGGRNPGNGGGNGEVSDLDTGNVEDDTDEGGVVELPETCMPYERMCLNRTTAVECGEDAVTWSEAPCPTGTLCENGACILPPETCTPGVTLGCESPSQIRTCDSDGYPQVETCPSATPTCLEGSCTDLVCVPNRRVCIGADVHLCSADGYSQTQVQSCEFGCSGGNCADPCAGDSKEYLGCSFWAVNLANYADSDGGGQPLAVALSNATRSPVDVSIETGAGAMLQELTIPPGALQTVELAGGNVPGSSLSSNSFKISTQAPITAHQFNPLNNVGVFSNDASLLLPATALGNEYVVLGWHSVDASRLRAYVTIIAVSEGTTEVTVNSPIGTVAASGVPALVPGVEQSFSLQQGQVLSFMTQDLNPRGFTGMTIIGNQNIAVFSGTECSNVPADSPYCDHLEQQLYPVNTWGTEFVAAKFKPRGEEPDVWRFVAAQDGTTVYTNPVIPVANGRTLGRGEWVEFESTGSFILTSDRPISLAQFMVGSAYPGARGGCDLSGFVEVTWGCKIPRTCSSGSGIGDPAFLLSVSNNQFREDYIFLTPAQYRENYITVVARSGTVLTMDGNAVTASGTRVGSFEIIYIPVTPGVHSINGNQPFGLYAYGYDCDVSYAYPGGLNLSTR